MRECNVNKNTEMYNLKKDYTQRFHEYQYRDK